MPHMGVNRQTPKIYQYISGTVTSRGKGGPTHVRAHRHACTLPNPEALGPEIEEGAVNRPTDPPLAFPRPGIGLMRIRQINSPYHKKRFQWINVLMER